MIKMTRAIFSLLVETSKKVDKIYEKYIWKGKGQIEHI